MNGPIIYDNNRSNLNRRGINGYDNLRSSQNDTNRYLLDPPPQPQEENQRVSNQNWRLFQDSVRQNIVWHHVRSFISKLKDLPVRKHIPELVRKKIQPKVNSCWEDDTIGWNSWRPDVIMNDITHFVFNCTGIFFFSTRCVLYKVDMGAFPILYIAALLVNAFYRCNTKLVYREKCIVHRKKLIIHYLTHHSILDCTIIYLCTLQLFRVDTSWYRLVIYLKLLDNRTIMKKIQELSDVLNNGYWIYQVFRVYMTLLIFAHTVAIIYIAMVSKDKHPSWMDMFNYTKDQDHWIKVYIRAIYWAIGTITVSSYGDTYPQRTKEVVIVVLIEVPMTAFISYWVIGLQAIYSQLTAPRDLDIKNLRYINRFLQTNKVPYAAQKRIKKAVHKMSRDSRPDDLKGQNDLIDALSPWIRDRLLESAHTRPMMTMSLWNRFSLDTLKKITTLVQRKLYYGTEVIIGQGTVPDRFYMLRNGKIYETYIDKNMKVDKVSEYYFLHGFLDRVNKLEGTIPNYYIWIGLESTIKQLQIPITVRSKGNSIVISVEVKKVQKVLQDAADNRDYESYCLFRDQMRQDSLKIHQVSCLHCPGKDHNILQCPFYHYNANKELIILKYIKRGQQRKKYDLMERVLQPRIKGKNTRRERMPWLKVGKRNENLIFGSLHSNHEQGAAIEKYRNKKSLKKYTAVETRNVNQYLTTLQNVDLPYEWRAYYTKYNVSKVKLRNTLTI